MVSKKSGSSYAKQIIGWREWCELPDINLPGVLAKVDTGAKTSSIHAFHTEVFRKADKDWVRFAVHPLQRHRLPEVIVEAPLVDNRPVTSSNGETEVRLVIETTMVLGGYRFNTELTLANRDEMGFRMLIGRKSLSKRFVVDPALSFTLGHRDERKLYPGTHKV